MIKFIIGILILIFLIMIVINTYNFNLNIKKELKKGNNYLNKTNKYSYVRYDIEENYYI